jgi:hypothetical protein
MLAFTSVYFSESNLFNELRAMSVRNRFPASARATGCSPTLQAATAPRPPARFSARDRFRQGELVIYISDYVKSIRGSSIDAFDRERGPGGGLASHLRAKDANHLNFVPNTVEFRVGCTGF